MHLVRLSRFYENENGVNYYIINVFVMCREEKLISDEPFWNDWRSCQNQIKEQASSFIVLSFTRCKMRTNLSLSWWNMLPCFHYQPYIKRVHFTEFDHLIINFAWCMFEIGKISIIQCDFDSFDLFKLLCFKNWCLKIHEWNRNIHNWCFLWNKQVNLNCLNNFCQCHLKFFLVVIKVYFYFWTNSY